MPEGPDVRRSTYSKVRMSGGSDVRRFNYQKTYIDNRFMFMTYNRNLTPNNPPDPPPTQREDKYIELRELYSLGVEESTKGGMGIYLSSIIKIYIFVNVYLLMIKPSDIAMILICYVKSGEEKYG